MVIRRSLCVNVTISPQKNKCILPAKQWQILIMIYAIAWSIPTDQFMNKGKNIKDNQMVLS